MVLTPLAGAEAGTTTKKAGGGLWEYGVESVAFSNYHHAENDHDLGVEGSFSDGSTLDYSNPDAVSEDLIDGCLADNGIKLREG